MSYFSTHTSTEHALLLATLFFSSLTFFSIFDQIKRIRQNKNAISLDPTRNVVVFFIYLAGFIHGFINADRAIMLNSLIAIPTLAVIYNIYLFDSLKSVKPKTVAILTAMLIAMIITPYEETLYLVIMMLGYAGAMSQLRTLYTSKTTGSLSPYVYVVGVLSSITWIIYAYSVNDVALKITTPISAVMNVSILLLWTQYKFADKLMLSKIVHRTKYYTTYLKHLNFSLYLALLKKRTPSI
jgi:uncharacterized protein with PQ loop repeat